MSNQSFLIFSIQGSLLAIDVHVVRKTLWLPELTPIEESPPYIVGVFNLRGKIIPVMDLNIRFGHSHPRYRVADSVIITEIDGRRTGIIVNEVHDVISIPPDDIEESPLYPESRFENQKSKIHPSHPHFVAGEAKVGEDIVMLLNHTNLLQITELPEVAGEEVQIHTTGRRYFCPEASPEERTIFHEHAVNLTHAAVGDDITGLLPLAVVGLSDEYFGIELELVLEFSDLYNLTPIPCCPEHIVGNMNLRGNIVTIVDIRNSLNMPVSGSSALKKVIVAGIGELLLGVAVDSVFDVIYLRLSEIAQTPSAVQKVTEKNIKGTALYSGKVMTILNLSNILTRDDLVVNEEA